MAEQRDNIYAHPVPEPTAFRFDDRVAQVFPDMIRRSVPGYSTIIAMTGLLAGRFATPGSRLYDLGCSLGASTLAMRQNVQHGDCRIVGVDNSAAMLERCRGVIDTDSHDVPVDLVCSNLQDVPVTDASVVVLNFTLQFIAREERDAVIQHIYHGLRPGGIMVLSEKVTFEDPHLDALNIDLHHDFKRANGYSDMEISQKRKALENVLIPETLADHEARLRQAGYREIHVWFRCFNFISLLAVR